MLKLLDFPVVLSFNVNSYTLILQPLKEQSLIHQSVLMRKHTLHHPNTNSHIHLAQNISTRLQTASIQSLPVRHALTSTP